MKILTLDVETSPILSWTWGLRDQTISLGQIVKTSELMCWSAKWVDEDEILFGSTRDGRKRMVKRLWNLLDAADVAVHFNGRRFDIPHINRAFLEAGLAPPSPYKQIDLWQTIKQFRFDSSKLDHVTQQLGLTGKEKHEGFGLWLSCMDGDSDAWGRMQSYNEKDVLLTEELYGIVRPWIKNHPSYAAFTGQDVCPACGSDDLRKRGWSYTAQAKFQRFRCNGCGGWSRSTVDGERVHVAQVA